MHLQQKTGTTAHFLLFWHLIPALQTRQMLQTMERSTREDSDLALATMLMEVVLSPQTLSVACHSALEDAGIRCPNHLLKSRHPYVQHPHRESPARAVLLHHHGQMRWSMVMDTMSHSPTMLIWSTDLAGLAACFPQSLEHSIREPPLKAVAKMLLVVELLFQIFSLRFPLVPCCRQTRHSTSTHLPRKGTISRWVPSNLKTPVESYPMHQTMFQTKVRNTRAPLLPAVCRARAVAGALIGRQSVIRRWTMWQ